MFKAEDKSIEIERGFILTMDSWENDGDHCATISKKFETAEEAEMVASIVVAYADVYGNQQGRNYVRERFTLTDSQTEYISKNSEYGDNFIDYARGLAYEMMGGSEDYICRVFDSYAIHEVEHDVSFKLIQYK